MALWSKFLGIRLLDRCLVHCAILKADPEPVIHPITNFKYFKYWVVNYFTPELLVLLRFLGKAENKVNSCLDKA